jgi:hypothetical protein
VAESVAERLGWETAVLGWPISANPLAVVKDQAVDDVPLRLVPRLRNQKTTIAGVRLPGWTGGRGFYLGDGDSYEIVQLEKTAAANLKIKSWVPYRFTGFWREDAWGSGWFEATGRRYRWHKGSIKNVTGMAGRVLTSGRGESACLM